MKFEDFEGMPSGTDYGVVLQWAKLDGEGFMVAFFAKGNPFGPPDDDIFTWVVEAKNGDVVFLSNEPPNFRPVFGLDSGEWQMFKHKILPIVDAYIAKNKEAK